MKIHFKQEEQWKRNVHFFLSKQFFQEKASIMESAVTEKNI